MHCHAFHPVFSPDVCAQIAQSATVSSLPMRDFRLVHPQFYDVLRSSPKVERVAPRICAEEPCIYLRGGLRFPVTEDNAQALVQMGATVQVSDTDDEADQTEAGLLLGFGLGSFRIKTRGVTCFVTAASASVPLLDRPLWDTFGAHRGLLRYKPYAPSSIGDRLLAFEGDREEGSVLEFAAWLFTSRAQRERLHVCLEARNFTRVELKELHLDIQQLTHDIDTFRFEAEEDVVGQREWKMRMIRFILSQSFHERRYLWTP